jgi:hypothetical protein
MFSAKKILERMDNEKFKHNNSESYEEFIKRIEKLRRKNDNDDENSSK